jgi:hypothetical protein
MRLRALSGSIGWFVQVSVQWRWQHVCDRCQTLCKWNVETCVLTLRNIVDWWLSPCITTTNSSSSNKEQRRRHEAITTATDTPRRTDTFRVSTCLVRFSVDFWFYKLNLSVRRNNFLSNGRNFMNLRWIYFTRDVPITVLLNSVSHISPIWRFCELLRRELNYCNLIKYKAVPLHPMKALGGRGEIAPTHTRHRH